MENNPLIVDCHYIFPQVACSYILRSSDLQEVAVIETNTAKAAATIEAAIADAKIEASMVRYIIVTHVHLDHAGGASTLLRKFPDARIVAHPRAARHLIDPSRLVMSAKAVYGAEVFENLYGEILPAPADKVMIPEDNTSIPFGNSKLHFIYTKGHANHHFVVYDPESKIVFTGDSFGLAYPVLQMGSEPFLFASSSPTDFDAQEAMASVQKIVDTGAQRAALTHFGIWEDMPLGKKQMLESLDRLAQIYSNIEKMEGSDSFLQEQARAQMQDYIDSEIHKRGLVLNDKELKAAAMDIDLNSQGLVFPILRARKKNKRRA